MRSRVIPGSSPTIDRRLAVNRLKSVLLPTLGRPTIATSGTFAAPAFTGTTDLRYVGKGNSSSETVEEAPLLQCTVRFIPTIHQGASLRRLESVDSANRELLLIPPRGNSAFKVPPHSHEGHHADLPNCRRPVSHRHLRRPQ